MNNKQRHQKIEEGIDIFEIIKVFYNGKFIILISTLIFLFIGYIYTINIPDDFQIKVDLSKASDSYFLKYKKLNNISQVTKGKLSALDVLNNDGKVDVSEINFEELYNINSDEVFEDFIFKLRQKNITTDTINNFIGYDKELNKDYYSLAKKFELIFPQNDNDIYKIFFKWQDKDQIEILLNEIIINNLKAVKDEIIKDLMVVIELIEFVNSRKIDQLNSRIKVLSQEIEDSITSQLVFLNEQLKLSKTNNFNQDLDVDEKSIYSNQRTLDIYSSNVPYHLRGKNALNQEIKNLKNRTEDEKLMLSNEYLNLISEVRMVESDDSIFQIKKIIEEFSNEAPINLINYNLSLTEIINLKVERHKYTLFIFAIIGFVIASFYIVCSFTYKKISEISN